MHLKQNYKIEKIHQCFHNFCPNVVLFVIFLLIYLTNGLV